MTDLRSAKHAELDGRERLERDLREAHREEMRAWRALHRWLEAWTYSAEAEDERFDSARELFAAVFHDGLRFLLYRYKLAWSEASYRLEKVEAHEEALEALGAGALLRDLRKVHRRYGRVLGIKAVPVPDPAPQIRKKLDGFNARLRELVVLSVAQRIEGGHAERAQVDRLLEPVMTWVSFSDRPEPDPVPPSDQPEAPVPPEAVPEPDAARPADPSPADGPDAPAEEPDPDPE